MSSTPDTASRTATTKSAEPARETTQNGSGAGEDDRQEGSRAEGDHEGARSEAESANPRGHRHSRLQALALGPKPARDLVPKPWPPARGMLRHSARRPHSGAEERRCRPQRGRQGRGIAPDDGPLRGASRTRSWPRSRRRARPRPAPPPGSLRRAPPLGLYQRRCRPPLGPMSRRRGTFDPWPAVGPGIRWGADGRSASQSRRGGVPPTDERTGAGNSRNGKRPKENICKEKRWA